MEVSRGDRHIKQWIKHICSTKNVYIRKMLKHTKSTPCTSECTEASPEEVTWVSHELFLYLLICNGSYYPMQFRFSFFNYISLQCSISQANPWGYFPPDGKRKVVWPKICVIGQLWISKKTFLIFLAKWQYWKSSFMCLEEEREVYLS